MLDDIISLEVAYYNMRVTSEPCNCDGMNIDNIMNLYNNYISEFNKMSNKKYSSFNNYFD